MYVSKEMIGRPTTKSKLSFFDVNRKNDQKAEIKQIWGKEKEQAN